jgi:hypothetical protein
VNKITICEIKSREKTAKNKSNKKCTTINNKNKWIVMNPIWHWMKKRSPSNGQNNQLVHWWLMVQSGPKFALSQAIEAMTFHGIHRLHSHNFIINLYTIPTTDVQLKMIVKRSSQKKRIFLMDICRYCWESTSTCKKIYCPNHWVTIRHTPNVYIAYFFVKCSNFENSFWNCRTLFSRIHKYSAKKCP